MNLYSQYLLTLLTHHSLLFSKQFAKERVVSREDGGGQEDEDAMTDGALVLGRVLCRARRVGLAAAGDALSPADYRPSKAQGLMQREPQWIGTRGSRLAVCDDTASSVLSSPSNPCPCRPPLVQRVLDAGPGRRESMAKKDG